MAREDTFLDALGEFTSMMQPGRTIQLSNKSGSLLQELEDATTQNQEQWVESIWDRADQERKKAGMEVLERDKNNPDSAAALDGMIVLGRSKTEAKGNVARSISLVLREGRTLDLVEEQAENDLREAVSAGNTSMETMRGIIERIEKSTGDKYLLDNTETGITEAWSSLVRLYTTGTRKGKGNKITAGARSEMASSIRSERQRLRSAETAGVTPSAFAKMREYLDYLKGIMGQVYRLQKARDAGLLDDLEAMIRESVGLKEQDALEAKVAEAVPTTYNLETGQGTSTFGYSISTKRDADYMAAVESGDVATQQAMVDEAAKQSGLPILDDSASEAFRARRTAAPKQTLRAFKLFATKPSQPGSLFPLFVGANDAVPQGIWLDAIEGKSAGTTKTGRPQVKSKLGPLAFRPGWHAGDMPLATHIGIKNAEGKVFARRANEVWAEVEMAQDVDYQEQANQSKTKDLREMPVDGASRFKTNPNMT
ncbi:MAG: hypothetical protein JZU63_05250, partial [Rhodoferax sp.]|nr:hypothetical protein [Rhodoferax sp.]